MYKSFKVFLVFLSLFVCFLKKLKICFVNLVSNVLINVERKVVNIVGIMVYFIVVRFGFLM